MIILIPAYEPNNKLINLVKQLKENCSYPILVVNDGSGDIFSSTFKEIEELGCIVVAHQINRGKGRALKTGFEYILNHTNESEGIVTADADGQHLVSDILKIAEKVISSPSSIVLGERKFSGKVPIASNFGNFMTRLVFSVASGKKVYDTQTGLRGFSSSLLPWLVSIDGERFEYEMTMLLNASSCNIALTEVEINTVYLDKNKSSHFRPLIDSLLVYLPILKFCFSSLCGAFVDYIALFLILWVSHSLLISVVGARVLSSCVNFLINRFFVFNHTTTKHKTFQSMVRYYILVCAILILNYLLLRFYSEYIRIPILWSKVLTECMLFLFSYLIQHVFIFKSKRQLGDPAC